MRVATLIIVYKFILIGAHQTALRTLQDATCEDLLAPDLTGVSCTVDSNTSKRKYGEHMVQNNQPIMYKVDESDNEPFPCLLDSGLLPICETSYGGVLGQTIIPHRNYRKEMIGPTGFDGNGVIEQNIRIHTVGNTNVVRDDFPLWSRWYQEYQNTQIFRMHNGEYKVDDNSRGRSAARIEAESVDQWKAGASWKRFSATYTLVKANDATIFQVFSSNIQWSVILDVDREGVLRYVERRGNKKLIFGDESALLRPFNVVVCDNGSVSEVFVDGVSMSDGIPYGDATDGTGWPRPDGAKTHFRWGTYVTSKNRAGEKNDAVDSLMFVAGAKIEDMGSSCGPDQ